MPLDEVLQNARAARAAGATRFCMGAAWRLAEAPRHGEGHGHGARGARAGHGDVHDARHAHAGAVARAQGRGARLLQPQPRQLGSVLQGDSSPRARTRTASTRCRTCATRASTCAAAVSSAWARPPPIAPALLATLANLPEHPESVPINRLVQVPGTPLHGKAGVDPLDFVRTIAVARILMPRSQVRLSAGRQEMSDELQTARVPSQARARFSTARSCSPPAIRTWSAIARCSSAWA